MATIYMSYKDILYYSYNDIKDTTIRVSKDSHPDVFQVFNFKLSDFEKKQGYRKMSKTKFNKYFKETLKKIREIAK